MAANRGRADGLALDYAIAISSVDGSAFAFLHLFATLDSKWIKQEQI